MNIEQPIIKILAFQHIRNLFAPKETVNLQWRIKYIVTKIIKWANDL